MPVGSIELITQSEYARRRGCSEAAVRRAIADKRISLIDGRIDPVAADAQWAQNTRVRSGSRPATAALTVPTAAASAAAAPSSPAGSGAADAPAGESPDAYWVVRARREKAEADLAELKLAEMRGELVPAADIRASHARRISEFREALMQLSARVAPLLIGMDDQAAIQRILDDEHRQALVRFSGST